MTRPADDQCDTCRYWDQRFPGRDLGVCRKMGILLLDFDAAITLSRDIGDDPHVTSDVHAVRTTADFGCIEHTPAGTWMTTRERRR